MSAVPSISTIIPKTGKLVNMNVFNKITEVEFNKMNMPVLFKEKDDRANNHFAIISDGISGFRISWCSDLEPVVSEVNPGIYSVGIDQHFAVVDFSSNKSLLTLDLFYNFYDTKIFNEWIFVISELEIAKIDKLDFKIIETYGLPDFFKEIEFKGEVAEVKCSSGEMIII